MFNLLTEKLIRFDPLRRQVRDGLPAGGLLHALMADEVEAFPALRPHQRHAWHAFLVQLGAIAMERDGCAVPPSSAGEWERIIRALTPGCPDYEADQPWRLVVDDIKKPAFMQPPALT